MATQKYWNGTQWVEIGGGSEAYLPINRSIFQQYGTSYSDVLVINGKGFLSKAVFRPTVNGHNANIKVIVDGVEIFVGKSSNNNRVSGLVKIDHVRANTYEATVMTENSAQFSTTIGGTPVDLPHLDESKSVFVTFDQPIKFSNSLVIQGKMGILNSSMYLYVSGGIS